MNQQLFTGEQPDVIMDLLDALGRPCSHCGRRRLPTSVGVRRQGGISQWGARAFCPRCDAAPT